MNPLVSTALSVLGFLVQHKDDVKALILQVEQLMGEAAGNEKAQAVKTFIGTALGIEAQLEQAWPLVSPIFNAFVALVKKTNPAPAQ